MKKKKFVLFIVILIIIFLYIFLTINRIPSFHNIEDINNISNDQLVKYIMKGYTSEDMCKNNGVYHFELIGGELEDEDAAWDLGVNDNIDIRGREYLYPIYRTKDNIKNNTELLKPEADNIIDVHAGKLMEMCDTYSEVSGCGNEILAYDLEYLGENKVVFEYSFKVIYRKYECNYNWNINVSTVADSFRIIIYKYYGKTDSGLSLFSTDDMDLIKLTLDYLITSEIQVFNCPQENIVIYSILKNVDNQLVYNIYYLNSNYGINEDDYNDRYNIKRSGCYSFALIEREYNIIKLNRECTYSPLEMNYKILQKTYITGRGCPLPLSET